MLYSWLHCVANLELMDRMTLGKAHLQTSKLLISPRQEKDNLDLGPEGLVHRNMSGIPLALQDISRTVWT